MFTLNTCCCDQLEPPSNWPLIAVDPHHNVYHEKTFNIVNELHIDHLATPVKVIGIEIKKCSSPSEPLLKYPSCSYAYFCEPVSTLNACALNTKWQRPWKKHFSENLLVISYTKCNYIITHFLGQWLCCLKTSFTNI